METIKYIYYIIYILFIYFLQPSYENVLIKRTIMYHQTWIQRCRSVASNLAQWPPETSKTVTKNKLNKSYKFLHSKQASKTSTKGVLYLENLFLAHYFTFLFKDELASVTAIPDWAVNDVWVDIV